MTATLLDLLEQADRHGGSVLFALDSRAVTADLNRWSWDHVRTRARRIAGDLSARGVRGQPLLLALPNGADLITAWWGAVLAGALPAIVAAPRPFGDSEAWALRLAGLHTACDEAPVIASVSTRSLLRSTVAGAALPCWTVDALDAAPVELPAPDPQAPALLQLTSGSVGKPKGVLLSHQAVVANARGIAARGAVTGSDLASWWVPMAHDMALLAHLAMTSAGATQIVLPTDHFVRNPAGWITLFPGQQTLTVGPPFAFERARQRLLRMDPPPDLSAFRTMIVGAEPIDAALLRRFERDLAPLGLRSNLFMPSYGLAEVSCVAALGAAGAPLRTERVARPLTPGRAVVADPTSAGAELVGHGPPLSQMAVRVVDDGDAPTPDGTIGHVQVRGASAMIGYWRDAQATARTVIDAGWIRTGDLGWIRDERVFIAGRHKDVIIHRGRNVLPEEIEELALSVPGVGPRGALAFGVPDPTGGLERVTLVIEPVANTDAATLVRALRVRVADALDLAIDHVELVPPGSLPRTTSGKLQRGVARARWGAS